METVSINDFRSRFEFETEEDFLKTGDFAKVYRANDKETHREVAVKISRDDDPLRRLPSAREVRKILKVDHPFLVKQYEFLKVQPEKKEKEMPFVAVVMDYITGGDLSNALRAPLETQQKMRIVEGILNGLEGLHDLGIIHGNLKPGNVLIQDIGHHHVRLSDFGFIKDQTYDEIGNRYPVRALAYLAPEQVAPTTFGRYGQVEENIDFWAFGMIVYEIFMGKYAFGEFEIAHSDMFSRIQLADLPDDIHEIPAPYSDLVRACLIRKAADRPRRIRDLRQILDGKGEWVNRKVRRKKPAPAPPAPRESPKPVICSNCGKENRPGTVICAYCRRAAKGPGFLKNYKRTGPIGFWAILMYTMVFLPIAFFYKGFFEYCIEGRHGKWNECLEEYANSLAAASGGVENAQAFLIGVIAFFVLTYLFSAVLFAIWYSRVSSNLQALGSEGRIWHPALLIGLIVVLLVSAIQPILMLIIVVGLSILALLAFQEIWKGSNPNYLQKGYNWKKSRGSFLIFSWAIASITFPPLLLLPFLPVGGDANLSKDWFLVAVGIVGIYWLLSILLVLRINMRQSAKYKAWARQG